MTDGENFLSIGEVLTQIQTEFPELSISKIRFLESKGLIDPERTPSGYRKFFSRDIQRLRRILQIQRETYMPLKMIKDILSEEESHQDDRTPPEESSPILTLIEGRRPSPQGELSPSDSQASHDPELGAGVGERAVVPPVDSSSVFAQETAVSELLGRLKAHDAAGAHRSSGAAQTLATSLGPTSMGVGPDLPPREAPQSSDPIPPTRAEVQDRALSPRVTKEVDAPNALLSIEELSRLTGAKISEINEMETYGLIESKAYAGERHYAQIDFEIVQILTVFHKFGIQARHLKMYKISAEREVGFMEQVIAPLLRQRNPGARKKASEQLSDLRTLGTCLRGYYIEKLLEKYLDL